MPKLRSLPFETAIIRRRAASSKHENAAGNVHRHGVRRRSEELRRNGGQSRRKAELQHTEVAEKTGPECAGVAAKVARGRVGRAEYVVPVDGKAKQKTDGVPARIGEQR